MSTRSESPSNASVLHQEMDDSFGWDTLQDRLRNSIVSISSVVPMDFDTESRGGHNATGFIVDAEQGIVLSNRHVMAPGPSYHKGTFFNNQEIHLQPHYYDPVHDFSFFRYDPAELKGIVPVAIRLAPEKARSGLPVRVIGNDSNEKMSVLQGELSQLDRNAPNYNRDGDECYKDFNTFYFQSATSSSGGSSGSPVVDIEGDAVALQAGGRADTASNFFLPLDRVKYALDYIRRGAVPPRGTMQAVFTHINHTDAERRGLEREAAVQEGACIEGTTGVLIVKKILASGPADGCLAIGDIVITANATAIHGFVELAQILDSSIGSSVCFRVFRNSQFVTVSVDVQDLHCFMPSKFLKIGGRILHDLSIHHALCASVPIFGVKITGNDNAFFPCGECRQRNVIYAINNRPTPNLEALMDVLYDVRREETVLVHVKNYDDLRDEAVFATSCPVVTLSTMVYTRSLATGFWSFKEFDGLAAPERISRPAQLAEAPIASDSAVVDLCRDMKAADLGEKSHIAAIKQAIVHIDARPLCPADGHYRGQHTGCGLVVDARRGLIVCPTDVVSNPTSHVTVTFGGVLRTPATVAYVHPMYPVSFLKYDPTLIADGLLDFTIVGSSVVPADGVDAAKPLATGESITVLFNTTTAGLELVKTVVSGRRTISTTSCNLCFNQRFFNIEVFTVAGGTTTTDPSFGAVCDDDGTIRGLYIGLPKCAHDEKHCGLVGIDISLMLPIITRLLGSDATPNCVRTLDVEYEHLSFAKAGAYGATSAHANAVVQETPDARAFLKVTKVIKVRPAETAQLEVGDIVLRANGKTVSQMADIACFYGGDSADLSIIRRGKEMALSVPTSPHVGFNTRRVVFWAGVYLQEPHAQVIQQATCVASQVHSFFYDAGTPYAQGAGHYDVFVTDVGGTPVNTLDDAVRVVKQLKSKTAQEFNECVAANERFSSGRMPGLDVTVGATKLTGEKVVEAIRTNDHYLPAWQLTRGPCIEDEWVYELL
ncbi:hypothetical protein IWQ57_002382 [Coemansia nantahalensis]|uniref:Uncharacterized protein n=1 Tax=Coemansia nantahalensis TaxID=2789366 RepID=A0ACC1K1D8_9FUNG|nr:hypothetical protein IWQ57_002382 [Coemansia nantahalensis]